MSVGLRFEVLGPVRVLRGGQDVRVTGRRQRLLLAVLLADAPRVVSAARLVDALWADSPEPRDPVNTLHQYVAHLRRALGEDAGGSSGDVLETSPPGYRLTPSVGGLDTVDLAAITARLSDLQQRGDHEATAEVASQALALWRGAPFAEFSDHPFLVPFVEAFTERRQVVVERLVASLAALGDYSRILSVIGAEPGWESRPQLASAYVAALAFTDRQGDALAAAEEHRRTLAERGLEPTVAFRRLAEEIAVRGRPRLDHAELVAVRSATAEILRNLLGRFPVSDDSLPEVDGRLDDELAAIEAANDPAVSGDADFWLATLHRRQPGVLAVLGAVDLGSTSAIDATLRLTVGYARFWDWTGDQRRLRQELSRVLDAHIRVGGGDDRTAAEAAGWLAYSSADDPARCESFLALAHERTLDDPLGAGRLLAVESVALRRRDPEAALDRGATAVRLLSHHGTPEETAYAHVVSSLAAIDADLQHAAAWHAQEADRLYRGVGDLRGLAWVDVVQSRLDGDTPSFARRFSDDHTEHTIVAMLGDDEAC